MPHQCNRKISVWVLAAVPWMHCVLLHAQTVDSPLRGAASCAASGCHGGPRAAVAAPDAPRGSEYPLWLEKDPHAQSWRTINSPASLKILEKLGIMKHGQIVDQTQFANCLACHNTAIETSSSQSLPRIAEGVGCEACHGPSADWYDSHFRGPDALQRAHDDLGLIQTKPLIERAEMCARCHVGAEDRDMNHDIIAAGHPALYFDMAVYHERLPKHWRDHDQDSPRFRSQLWLAGQMAKVQAELELIETRATQSHTVSCWPELSQYQCSSCHNELDGFAPRLLSQTSSNSLVALNGLGKALVRQWNLSGWELLVGSQPDQPEHASLKESLLAMQSGLSDLKIDKHQTVERNREAIEKFKLLRSAVPSQAWLDAWDVSEHRTWAVTQLRRSLDEGDWEQAALGYVAAWALVPSQDSEALRSSLETMRSGLIFPARSQSPVLPLISDTMAHNPSEPLTPLERPTQAEWRSAVERVIEHFERRER